MQAESLHDLTEIILVFLPFVVKRKDEKHRKNEAQANLRPGMILAAKEGKQTLFLVRNALERGYGVAGRVDGAAHRLFVKRLLGEDDGLTPAMGVRR